MFLLILSVRPLRTSCWIVGTGWYLFPSGGFGIPWLRTPPSLRRDHRCPRCRLGVPCELRTGKPSRSNSSGRESPCQARTSVRTNRTCLNRVSPCIARVKPDNATTKHARETP
ncbi:hypothetical protein JCM18918_3472 [Cutibacterium acnes JCM 18918]|nr:hypothetical protein JCM18918_3472 [Cutibacterium acnes JCM 18918]